MSEFAVEFVYSTADTNKDQKVSADEIRLAVPLYLALQVRNATSLDPDGGDSFAQHCADPAPGRCRASSGGFWTRSMRTT